MEKILPIIFLMIYVSAGMMTGGWSDVKDLNSATIQGVAKNATVIVANSMNSQYHLKMMNLTSARKQLVSGMNYKMEILIAPTECKKGRNYTQQELEDCPLQQCDNPLRCTVVAWVQPWLADGFKVTSSQCDSNSFC